MKYRLSEKEIKVIESILDKEDRVELIPGKDGIKAVHIKRKTINIEFSQPKAVG